MFTIILDQTFLSFTIGSLSGSLPEGSTNRGDHLIHGGLMDDGFLFMNI